MHISNQLNGRAQAVTNLFNETFSASEGEDEGALIGDLVQKLLTTTGPEDLHVFTASEGDMLTGAIIFTRLTFAGEARVAFMLAPVAVATAYQGKGIGQKLIRHGLDAMKEWGTEIAITYGDPNYYSRVGFVPVSVDDVPPPLPPQYPEGWMAQSLSEAPLGTLKGPSTCAPAFDNPVYW